MDRSLAYMIISFGVIGLIVTFTPFNDGVEKNIDFITFGISMSLIHFVIGIAALKRTRYGFIALKYYLHVFKLFVPIGTYISYKVLKYIKDNNIERLYMD